MAKTKPANARRPKDQKRIPLSMRITPGMREDLVAKAADKGRSITQEAEFRLEFAGTVEPMFNGDLRKPNLAMVATFEHAGKAAARWLPESARSKWLADGQCFRAALAETVMAMLELGPDGFSRESTIALFQVIERRLNLRIEGLTPDEPRETIELEEAPDGSLHVAKPQRDEDSGLSRSDALIKAARAAGCVIARIEVGKDGLIKLVLHRGDEAHPPEPAAGCNEWDDILK